jgi:RNA polymerase sigma-70 factor
MSESEAWFLEQVERSHVGLRAYIRSLGVRAEEVDDLAQEAFLIGWEKIDEFARAGGFDAWVRQIARRLIANERRKGARRGRILSDRVTQLLLEAEAAGDGGGHLGPDTERELRALRECMSELPDDGRDLLHRRYFQELSPGAIGGLLGKSSNQVRQSLMRLRRALLWCMKRRLPATPG